MKFQVILMNNKSILIDDAEDMHWDTEDNTVNFYLIDETLVMFPRERVLFVKEVFNADPKSLN